MTDKSKDTLARIALALLAFVFGLLLGFFLYYSPKQMLGTTALSGLLWLVMWAAFRAGFRNL